MEMKTGDGEENIIIRKCYSQQTCWGKIGIKLLRQWRVENEGVYCPGLCAFWRDNVTTGRKHYPDQCIVQAIYIQTSSSGRAKRMTIYWRTSWWKERQNYSEGKWEGALEYEEEIQPAFYQCLAAYLVNSIPDLLVAFCSSLCCVHHTPIVICVQPSNADGWYAEKKSEIDNIYLMKWKMIYGRIIMMCVCVFKLQVIPFNILRHWYQGRWSVLEWKDTTFCSEEGREHDDILILFWTWCLPFWCSL